MIIKSIVMLSLFFVPIIIINTGIVGNFWLLLFLYLVSGLGMSGIGMGIMHDANHGSYSKNRKINKIMGYTLNLVGADAKMWRLQHNVLHHTYTNINESDEDLDAPFFLRFSPHKKRYWVHKFQFLYAWFFYGLSSLAWVTSKDFTSIIRYKKMGLIKEDENITKEVFKLIGWKLAHFSYALIIPMMVVPLSPWLVLLAFVIMHFFTGIFISSVFQTAHVLPATDFPLPDKDGMMDNWSVHQLLTTSNFSPKSRLTSWLIGGLNYQIEHHLFPNICHVHYRRIAPIVRKTAQEFGTPYLIKRTFVAALWDHLKMLYWLGRMDTIPAK